MKSYTEEEVIDLLNKQTIRTLEVAAAGFETVYAGQGFAAQQVAANLYNAADYCREVAGL